MELIYRNPSYNELLSVVEWSLTWFFCITAKLFLLVTPGAIGELEHGDTD